jgi:hypothetical protein
LDLSKKDPIQQDLEYSSKDRLERGLEKLRQSNEVFGNYVENEVRNSRGEI